MFLGLAVLVALLRTALAFPTYDDPITADPVLSRPDPLLCTLPLITDAACDSFDKVTVQQWTPPGLGCAGQVTQAVLDFRGAVKGMQYDRMGSVFLDGVELLRTTTPEPTAAGIRWHIEKDVSEYLRVFLRGPAAATLTIPSMVNSQYTGVIRVNVTVSFYGTPASGSTTPAADSSTLPSAKRSLRTTPASPSVDATRKSVTPHAKFATTTTAVEHRSFASDLFAPSNLVDSSVAIPAPSAPLVRALSPGAGVGMAGNTTQTFVVHWPVPNVARAYLDLYASGHGCEEFYYSNLPDDEATGDGYCGGGVYRELQVYVDGRLAGAAYPFVVLYTGGVNPLLWRPLTGILSFDIPAYRFDITPFVGELNSGGSHTISVKVLGNNADGSWYVSPILLLYPDNDYEGVTLHGTVDGVFDLGGKFNVEKWQGGQEGPQMSFKTNGRHTYSASGYLDYPNGKRVRTTVSGQLLAWNDNAVKGAETQTVNGLMSSTHLVEHVIECGVGGGQDATGWSAKTEVRNSYPYFMELKSANDEASFEVEASIDIGMEREWRKTVAGIAPLRLALENRIQGHALYNRTEDHKTTNKQQGETRETFFITSSIEGPCYSRSISARNGSILHDDSTNTCTFHPGVTFCASSLCPKVHGTIPLQEINDIPPDDTPAITAPLFRAKPAGDVVDGKDETVEDGLGGAKDGITAKQGQQVFWQLPTERPLGTQRLRMGDRFGA